MSAAPLELAGILIGCGAAALALAANDTRVRSAAIIIALLAAPLLVLGNVWDEPRVVDLRDSPATLIAGLGIGALALAGLTAPLPAAPRVACARGDHRPSGAGADRDRRRHRQSPDPALPGDLRRRPRPRPSLARSRARTPARRGSCGCCWRPACSSTRAGRLLRRRLERDREHRLLPGPVRGPLRAARRARVDARRLLGRALVAVGAVALVCAAVAIVQFIVRDLFLNEELLDANQLHVYFRVNSIFFDPNIFGRYLALAMIALAAYIAWERGRLRLLAATAGFAVCLLALAFSYSISGFAALLAGLGMIAILRWSWRGLAAAAAVGTVGAGGAGDRRRHADERHRGHPLDRQRPRGPARRWARAVRQPAASRLRLGLLRPRLLRRDRAGRSDHGLALRAGHGRRRAGRDRPRLVSRRCSARRWQPCSRRVAGIERPADARSRPASSRC